MKIPGTELHVYYDTPPPSSNSEALDIDRVANVERTLLIGSELPTTATFNSNNAAAAAHTFELNPASFTGSAKLYTFNLKTTDKFDFKGYDSDYVTIGTFAAGSNGTASSQVIDIFKTATKSDKLLTATVRGYREITTEYFGFTKADNTGHLSRRDQHHPGS